MKRYHLRKRDTGLLALAALMVVTGVWLRFAYTPVRFTAMLLACAGAVLALWVLLTVWDRGGWRWAVLCRRGLCLALALGTVLFAVMEAWVISWARTDEDTAVSAVIVFGAGVNGTVPSLSLQVRLQAALDYLEDRPGIPVVVTGSQGPGEEISEARCMADWLVAMGVAPERILLEEQADNTEENVRFSRALLREHGVDVTDNIAYVTADYHLCRAIYLTGYPYCVPVAARLPEKFWPLTVNYFIREAFAMAAEVVLPG